MGEVYRARDTSLARDVAIKVLPDAFASDGDRLARFEREAKTLATLNHPNIAQVYGLESGALIMELVDGEDLSHVIARGPVAPEAALAIARQIASALDAAHEQNIVHRDLKPANIKVRPDDTVKVLDFGLAKAIGLETSAASADAAKSPTLTARATELGVILGTAAYMAPEQARGKPVDRRADIWAFGVVFFEMLTSRRAFGGDDVSDVLASVLKTEPDWAALPADLPAPVRRLLGRCLEKDPKRRLRDISEGMLQLDEESRRAPILPARRPIWRRALPFVATAVVTALAVWAVARRGSPAGIVPDIVRFSFPLPAGADAAGFTAATRDVAITHDGRAVAFAVREPAMSRLYLRRIGQLEATPIHGAEGAAGPFVSSDDRWIGFLDLALTRIKKVSITGGPARVVAQADTPISGSAWLPNGTIVFGTADSGLKRVSDGGGPITEVTTLDRSLGDASHCWPSVVPGTTVVLFSILSAGGVPTATLAVVDVATGRMVRLPITGTAPHYASSGHIVYAVSGGTIYAAPFDLGELRVTGQPAVVLEDIGMKPSGAANFDLSPNGRLVYTGATLAQERALTWVDRRGQETPVNASPRAYFYPRVSRDGRLVVDVRDQERDIWVLDPRGALRKLTSGDSAEEYGVWTPDGTRIVFSRRGSANDGIFWTRADGIGEPERLVDRRNAFPNAVTADGKTLIFRAASGVARVANDILAMPLEGDAKVRTLIATEYNELNAVLSPDNRWLAYQSDLSGRMEIYARPYPDVDAGQNQISIGGGTEPLWADGEIFYRSVEGNLMSVAVKTGRELVAQPPTTLFDTSRFATYIGRNYDITPDGKRFVFVKNPAVPAQTLITVVLDWTEELKRVK